MRLLKMVLCGVAIIGCALQDRTPTTMSAHHAWTCFSHFATLCSHALPSCGVAMLKRPDIDWPEHA